MQEKATELILNNLRGKFWYFSHPYGDDEQSKINYAKALERTNALLDRGIIVFNPIVYSHFLHVKQPREASFWYEWNFQLVGFDIFHGIILAPEWENSRGCNMEFGIFLGMKKPIIYFEDILKEKIETVKN